MRDRRSLVPAVLEVLLLPAVVAAKTTPTGVLDSLKPHGKA